MTHEWKRGEQAKVGSRQIRVASVVEMQALPKCDFCSGRSIGVNAPNPIANDATWDGPTKIGPWAHMCDRHMESAGLSYGTRLVLAMPYDQQLAKLIDEWRERGANSLDLAQRILGVVYLSHGVERDSFDQSHDMQIIDLWNKWGTK